MSSIHKQIYIYLKNKQTKNNYLTHLTVTYDTLQNYNYTKKK